jgi:hypothetical protein
MKVHIKDTNILAFYNRIQNCMCTNIIKTFVQIYHHMIDLDLIK